MDLRRHLGKLGRQRNFYVKRSGRDCKLKGHSVLRILSSLPVEDDIGVHLAKFVDLDVGHSHIVVHHLLPGQLFWLLAGQHIVVRVLVKHALF